MAHGFDRILLCRHLSPILPLLPAQCSFPHLYFSFSTTSLCPSPLIFPAVYSSACFFFPSFCLLSLPCYTLSLPLPLCFHHFLRNGEGVQAGLWRDMPVDRPPSSSAFKPSCLGLILFLNCIIHTYMGYQIAVSWEIALTNLHMKCLNPNLLV